MKRLMTLITVAASAILLQSCADMTGSGSKSVVVDNVAAAVTTQSVTTTSVTTTETQTYVDQETRIDYPRPTAQLRKGSKGDEVKWLQTALNRVMDAGIIIDGDFGGGTYGAVCAFQGRCGLTADGWAGEATVSKLTAILSGKEKLPAEQIVTTTYKQIVETPTYTTKAVYKQSPVLTEKKSNGGVYSFYCNDKTKKIHTSDGCSAARSGNAENFSWHTDSLDGLRSKGYSTCGKCKGWSYYN